MKGSKVWAIGLAAIVFGSTASGGCGETSESPPAAGVADSGSLPDVGVADTPLLGDVEGETPCETGALHCSADQQHFVDCNEKVVSSCPSGQGCTDDGTCIPACDVAKAAHGSTGCEFYVVHPFTVAFDDCYALVVVNTWNTSVELHIDRAGTTYDPSQFAYIPRGNGKAIEYDPLPGGTLPAGEVAIVFLGDSPTAFTRCPATVQSATFDSTFVYETGRGKAFHLTTSVPVAVYDIAPYGGGDSAVTSSSLLLPVPAWGTNYIGIDGYEADDNWIAIVAAEDGTDVTVSPTVDIVGGTGVDPVPAGTLHTYTLNKGEVLQLSQTQELIGTPIQATKPIGVSGGVACAFVPKETPYCDSMHQQIPSVQSLGSEYVAVRHRDRYEGAPESPPWRIVGAVDGTILTYFPARPDQAPATLESGQMEQFNAGDPFIVTSQDASHPFYLGEYMPGCRSYGDDKDCRGDPELVNVLPPQQYMKSYTFFTDPTYSETNLVVVRAKNGGKFADVVLDCAGRLDGWQPLGTKYEWTRTDLVRHDFEAQGSCDNGRHEISSNGPFGMTVWGWGSADTGHSAAGGFTTQCVSYGYPAGGGTGAINTVVVTPVPK